MLSNERNPVGPTDDNTLVIAEVKTVFPWSLAGDYFGRSVAISGDTLIVGASGDNCAAGDYCGSAFIFEKPASGWIDVTKSSKLTASDSAYDDNFGYSVAISSNTVIVGAYGDDCADSSVDCGSAYLFEKPVSGWLGATQSTKLTASDGLEEDEFGGSVAISGDTVIVGTTHNSESAYIFKGKMISLGDVILILQTLSGETAEGISTLEDINSDGKIGIAEAIHTMKAIISLE